MLNLRAVVESGLREGVQSVFLFAGLPPLGTKGRLIRIGNVSLDGEDVTTILKKATTPWQYRTFESEKELEFSHEMKNLGRFRVTAFYRKGKAAMVLRPVPSAIPTLTALGLPRMLEDFAGVPSGLVLVTGPSKSGKSTTLAAMTEAINAGRRCHIVTIEDVIEFVYRPQKAIISQREIGRDTVSLQEALRRVLREDPDVVIIGDVRDAETMKSTLKLAETGHLVFASMHTSNAVQTINRILDFYPESEQRHVRAVLAQVLAGVVSQRLIPRTDGAGFVCACEVLTVTAPVRTLIREDKAHQIWSAVDASKRRGMLSMDDSLHNLYRQGLISIPEAIGYSSKGGDFIRKVAAAAQEGESLMTGKKFLDLSREAVVYRADFRSENLASFDASGALLSSPLGLLFRDRGRFKGDMHYIADYTALKPNGDPIATKSLFNLAYRVNDVKHAKSLYDFQVRVVQEEGREFTMPRKAVGLVADRDWHTLAIPIPPAHAGGRAKYYMLLFDAEIREIIFDDICFS